LEQAGMLEGSDRDGVYHARQHPGRVRNGFSAAELRALRRDHDGMASELQNGHFQRKPRARRSLFEDQRYRLAGQWLWLPGFPALCLPAIGCIQEAQEALRAEIGEFCEVADHAFTGLSGEASEVAVDGRQHAIDAADPLVDLRAFDVE